MLPRASGLLPASGAVTTHHGSTASRMQDRSRLRGDPSNRPRSPGALLRTPHVPTLVQAHRL